MRAISRLASGAYKDTLNGHFLKFPQQPIVLRLQPGRSFWHGQWLHDNQKCGCKNPCGNQIPFFDLAKSVPYLTQTEITRFSNQTSSRKKYSTNIPSIEHPASNQSGNDTRTRNRTLDQVVYHLQADIRRKRRIHKAEIHNAIELVEEASKVENFGAFLLNCCSDILPDLHPNYRVKLAGRIWAVIQKGKEYSSTHFEAMLKALALNEDKDWDPFSFLEEANASGVNITVTMYFFSLLILCQRGDLESAVKILNMMKDNAMSVNERFFNALMIGNLRAGDYKGATDILDIMRASQIEPSIHTWCTLLQVHIEMENLKEVQSVFSQQKIIGSQLSEDQFYDLLKTAARQQSADVMDVVIQKSLESGKMHALSIINLVLQLTHLGYADNGIKLILQFESCLRTRKEHLGTFFIRELHTVHKLTNHEAYVRLVSHLQAENRNPYAFNIAAESCLKHKKFDVAYSLFNEMLKMNLPIRPHYYLPAFISEIENNGITGGISVLTQMHLLGIAPDWEMLLNWVIPLIYNEEGNMVETLKIIKETCNVSYSSGLFGAGLIVALHRKAVQEGVALINKLSGKISNPEAVMQALFLYVCDMEDEAKDLASVAKYIEYVYKCKDFNDREDHVGIFLARLIEADRSEEAKLFLTNIVELEIPVSAKAAEIFKEKLAFAGTLKIDAESNFNFQPNGLGKFSIMPVDKMNTVSLESHKVELESKEMNTRGTTRKLFLKYCASENLDKVLQAKTEFENEHGVISRGMKAALMGAYIRNGVLEPAWQLYQELTNVDNAASDVVVDVYKVIDLATLMVQNGQIEAAVDLILQICPSRRVHRPENITRNVIKLLEAIYNSKINGQYVYDLTQLFLKLRFIKPTNPALAPSIKDRILENNLEAAVEVMEEYAQKYSVSPCLQELTYAVLDEPELLERVVKCSIATRGEPEAKRLLALARSDMGDIDGAAKGFLALGQDLRFPSMVKQCEYLSTRNEIQKILNLISALQKTGQNYDVRSLFEVAVQSCKRSGNTDGLRKLISSMEDKDIYVSPKVRELSSQT